MLMICFKEIADMKFVKFNVFLIIIGTGSLGDAPKHDYLKGFTNYLQKESKLHQVMFVIGDHMMNYPSSRVNPLVREVGKHFPTLCISLSSFRYQFIETNYSSALQNPRRTTLFILFLSGNPNETRIQEVTVGEQLNSLSMGYSHPKCMINLFPHNNSLSIKKLIKRLWRNEFLDIAVMTQPDDNQRFLITDKLNQSILHQMNSFSGTYFTQKLTDDVQWFPNKLRNLHKYMLKFCFTTDQNSLPKGENLKKIRRFVNLLTTNMNCRTKTLFFKIKDFGAYGSLLSANKMEMDLHARNVILVNQSHLKSLRMRITSIGSLKAVIPKHSRTTKTLTMSEELITMMCVTVGAIILLRITALVLKLRRRTWRTFNVSRIVLGMSTDNEPEESPERIIFGVLMICCIAYSSYFYSVILDINWRPQAEITTLKELLDSDLTHMTSQLVKEMLLISPISEVQKLGTKSTVYPDQWRDFNCLAFLSKYGNVTCIISDSQEAVKDFESRTQKWNMKVLPKSLSYYFQTFMSRRNSPYIDQFNEKILRASESGILSKLIHNDTKKQLNHPSGSEEISGEKLLPLVFHTLAIGYTLALIAFIVEVQSIMRWSKIRSFCTSRLIMIRDIFR
ncbi:uncharacterized protein LOC122505009 [Leptopilina heterotoma]|uniref:uncharacterized protein LOC122505009 n=1 Tax=Leptopilina heterotoma TaxID=63436 RepID=UPI001CA7CA03|nr:uncharacterized protein LOC122505009 [Leptopilina heterotoma]